MVLLVCNHFIMDAIHDPLFQDHELEAQDNILEENHRASLIKLTAERYFTLRLFTYGKRYNDKVVNGQPSIRHPDWKVYKMRKGDRSFTENMRIKILKIAQIIFCSLGSHKKKLKSGFLSACYISL